VSGKVATKNWSNSFAGAKGLASGNVCNGALPKQYWPEWVRVFLYSPSQRSASCLSVFPGRVQLFAKGDAEELALPGAVKTLTDAVGLRRTSFRAAMIDVFYC
jgi:hypothetical protein